MSSQYSQLSAEESSWTNPVQPLPPQDPSTPHTSSQDWPPPTSAQHYQPDTDIYGLPASNPPGSQGYPSAPGGPNTPHRYAVDRETLSYHNQPMHTADQHYAYLPHGQPPPRQLPPPPAQHPDAVYAPRGPPPPCPLRPPLAPHPSAYTPHEAQELIKALQTCLEVQEAVNKVNQECMVQHDLLIKDLQTAPKPRLKSDKNTRNNQIQALVHKVMHRLLGIEAGARGRLPSLPLPLAESEPPHHAQDGTALFNPDWRAGLSSPESHKFVKTAAELALEQEKANPSCGVPADALSLTLFHQPAKKYFGQLRRTYLVQTSPGASKKSDRHQTKTRRRSRKAQKAKLCRRAVEEVEQFHGAEKVVGLAQLFDTDYMTSEYSHADGGNLSEDAWRTHKSRHVPSIAHAFERRHKVWKSKEYRRIQLYTLSFARKAALQDKGTEQDSAQHPRFPCHIKNVNDEAPKPRKTGANVYDKCVSAEWSTRKQFAGAMETVPPHYTIFSLEIPDELLSEQDRAYLAECDRIEQLLAAEAAQANAEDADDESELDANKENIPPPAADLEANKENVAPGPIEGPN